MTVYEKLVQARLKFQSAEIKKSGKNTYAGYTYFELSDILPICNKICEEVKAVCVVSFNDTIATLEFVDCESPENKITFTSPMSKASLKGCHDVQNLGAVETYIKRYLYQNCFEIAESDSLNGTMKPLGQPPRQAPQAPRQAPQQKCWSKEQLAEMGNILNSVLPNGNPCFTEEEKQSYRDMAKQCKDFATSIKLAKEVMQLKMETAKVPEDLF